MKIIRGILSGLIGIIIFILIFALSFSYSLDGIIKKDILKGVVKEEVINEYIKIEDEDIKKSLENIFGETEIASLAQDLIDEYLKYTKDNTYELSNDFINKVIDFCVKHKDEISKISKEEVTEEQIRSKETYDNIKKLAKENFPEIQEKIGEGGEIVVKVYSIVISPLSRLIVISIILALIVLYSILNWSLYKFLKPLSISLMISGIMYLIFYITIMILKNELLKQIDLKITINPTTILIVGIIEVIISIISIIVKKIIEKKEQMIETY